MWAAKVLRYMGKRGDPERRKKYHFDDAFHVRKGGPCPAPVIFIEGVKRRRFKGVKTPIGMSSDDFMKSPLVHVRLQTEMAPCRALHQRTKAVEHIGRSAISDGQDDNLRPREVL